MDRPHAMARFVDTFVRRDYRARCRHEAVEKPARMMARICHSIDSVFGPEHEHGQPGLDPDASGFLYDLGGHVAEVCWSEALRRMGRGGGGYLFVSESGDAFYAESEGCPPPRRFGGRVSR